MSNEYIEHGDVLDVRDIAGHIREAASVVDAEDCTEDEQAEALEALKAYAEAFPGYPEPEAGDWEALADAWDELDGPTAIRESYWEDYVAEYLKETGYLPSDLAWFIVIDWEKTAAHVLDDYTEFELDGVTYYIRL